MSENKIPSKLSQILTVCRYELLIHFRKKKIFAILGIAVGVSVLFMVMTNLMGSTPFMDANFILSIPLSFAPLLIILLASLFGSDSIVTEFKNKTGNTLFPNPVSRTSIWFGKFLSTELISVGVIILFYSIIIVHAAVQSQEIGSEVFLSLSFSLVALTMIVSFAFLISSAFRGVTGATVLVFFLFIIILPLIDQVLGTILETKPWFSPTFAYGIIQHSLTVPYPTDGAGILMLEQFGTVQFIPEITTSLLVMAAYTVAACTFSILIFRRREMK